MRGPAPDRGGDGGFDPFATAVVMGLVSGFLALVDPWFEPLVGVLAALAVAAWATDRPRTARRRWSARTAGAFVVLGGAGVLYSGGLTPLGPARGLLLAAALLPLWFQGRARPGRHARAVGTL